MLDFVLCRICSTLNRVYSCSRSERKELLAGRGWRKAIQAPDEARGFLGRVQADAFRGAVVHSDEHRHLAYLDGGFYGVVTGLDFVRLRGDDRADMRILGLWKRA
jgi:hypothetical protein